MSRRILLTAYNPAQASQGVLYPCHSIIVQFYVDMMNPTCSATIGRRCRIRCSVQHSLVITFTHDSC